MPLDNKPPDPILEEFSTLTRMSSKSLSHIHVIPSGDSIPLGLEVDLEGLRIGLKVKIK
ncbi:hypothetical protein Tco_1356374, partial [Tanacetum coccineum]